MSVFKSKQNQTELQSLEEESDNIIGNFMKVSSNLTSVNNKIEQVRGSKQTEIEILNNECNSLKSIQERNQRFVDKINSFLE